MDMTLVKGSKERQESQLCKINVQTDHCSLYVCILPWHLSPYVALVLCCIVDANAHLHVIFTDYHTLTFISGFLH